MRSATCALVVLAMSFAVAPSRATAQTATVDQVLAALAEVLRDRAKQVASATIAARLRDQLCKGTVEVRPHRSDSDATCRRAEAASQGTAASAPPPAGQPTCETSLTLYLGGRDACRKAQGPCLPDDVFVRSCRLAAELQVQLSDPYYLKSLSRDALDFLMRVSASGLSEEQYRSHGIGDVAQYMHAVLEQVVSRDARIGDLAGPTLSLADQLSRAMPRTTIETVGRDTSTLGLRTEVARIARRWVASGCPGGVGARQVKACEAAGREPTPAAAWFVGDVAAPDDEACRRFKETAAQRIGAFRKLFDPGAPYEAARNEPCEEALPAGDLAHCRAARLTLNLHDALTKVACVRPAGDGAVRETLREMIYVLGEQDVYRPALAGDAPAAKAFEDWVAAVGKIDVRDLPREELAYGVRVMGTYLRAAQEDPVGTARWLELLEQDLNAIDRSAGTEVGFDEMKRFRTLLHGSALGSGREPGSAPVRALRGTVKDLLVLPSLVVVQHESLVQAAAKTRAALLVLVRKVHSNPGEQPRSLEGVLGSLADFVTALAEVTREVARLGVSATLAVRATPAIAAAGPSAGPEPAAGPSDAATLFRVADALDQSANALRLASKRDWVGLAIVTAEEVERRVTDRDDYRRLLPSLRFVRVLLSMYQAADVKEAKGIFEANLEDVASRERRYDDFAVDAAALAGVRWGYQRARAYADGTSSLVHPFPQIYGLFAPFGVQATFKLNLHLGLLVYPVDLGSYLVASDRDAAKPVWQDAFRIGVTPFVRLGRRIPVVAGVGGDVRPRVNERVEWRGYVHLSLELPLYVLY